MAVTQTKRGQVLYEGDPRIVLSENGSSLVFKNGQPVMDGGLENAIILSLFCEPWLANQFFRDTNQQLGSLFIEAIKKPITLQNLQDARKAALTDLEWMLNVGLAREVEVFVVNTTGSQWYVKIIIYPPSDNPQTFVASNNGANWVVQTINPASERAGDIQ